MRAGLAQRMCGASAPNTDKEGATVRAWDDFVVASHVFFLPAQIAALARGVYDAFALTSAMLVLSVWYHRSHERNVAVARIELCSTSALFAYGMAQARVCPHAVLQFFELVCAALVLATYAACFRLVHSPAAYDRWHPLGLHVVPAAWALAVGLWHECLVCN